MLNVAPSDVKDALPPGAQAPPDDYLQVLIEQAITRLYVTVPRLDSIIGSSARKAEFAEDMIVAAVKRVIINAAAAQGFKSESEGNYSYQVSSALEASANIWFPDKDLSLLVPARPAVGVIHMSRPRRDW